MSDGPGITNKSTPVKKLTEERDPVKLHHPLALRSWSALSLDYYTLCREMPNEEQR